MPSLAGIEIPIGVTSIDDQVNIFCPWNAVCTTLKPISENEIPSTLPAPLTIELTHKERTCHKWDLKPGVEDNIPPLKHLT